MELNDCHRDPAALPPGKKPVPIIQEAGKASGQIWTGRENLSSPGFESRTLRPVTIRVAIPTTLNISPLEKFPASIIWDQLGPVGPDRALTT